MTQRLAAVALALILLACTEPAGRAGKPGAGTLTLDRASGAERKWEPFASLTPARRTRSVLRFAHTGEVAADMLRDAGFADVRIEPKDASRAFIREWAPGRRVEDYVVSASIEAVKPSV